MLEKERLDLRKIYLEHRSAFIDYLIKIRAINKTLAMSYVSAVDRLLPDGVTTPKELEQAVIEAGKKDKLIKGLRALFNYLEDQLEISELNGYSFDAWRKKLKIPKPNAREVYITDRIPRNIAFDDQIRLIKVLHGKPQMLKPQSREYKKLKA